MKIEYSETAGALYVYLQEVDVCRSVETVEGVVVDLDSDGGVVGVEILNVSTKAISDIEVVMLDSLCDESPSLVEDDVD